jgi:NAD(P)-dependent dehydrogenase (short-subunit alcohol dehydrogenase family)
MQAPQVPMKNETVVVFGGSSGIGEATAAAALRQGARVVIAGRDAGRLEAAKARLGAGAEAAAVDATKRAEVDAFFRGLGRFDHLVLALSGAKGAGAFRELPIDDVRVGLETKLLPHLSVAQAALPTLRADGSLTFVSAASARSSMPGTAGLAAINAAIEAAARVLAVELAPLRVNAVSPGIVDTPWWDAVPAQFKQGAFAQACATLPSRRVGRPEEVGELIALILRTGFIAGSVFEVDGGHRLVAS